VDGDLSRTLREAPDWGGTKKGIDEKVARGKRKEVRNRALPLLKAYPGGERRFGLRGHTHGHWRGGEPSVHRSEGGRCLEKVSVCFTRKGAPFSRKGTLEKGGGVGVPKKVNAGERLRWGPRWAQEGSPRQGPATRGTSTPEGKNSKA